MLPFIVQSTADLTAYSNGSLVHTATMKPQNAVQFMKGSNAKAALQRLGCRPNCAIQFVSKLELQAPYNASMLGE
jgi:hypothetical protein